MLQAVEIEAPITGPSPRTQRTTRTGGVHEGRHVFAASAAKGRIGENSDPDPPPPPPASPPSLAFYPAAVFARPVFPPLARSPAETPSLLLSRCGSLHGCRNTTPSDSSPRLPRVGIPPCSEPPTVAHFQPLRHSGRPAGPG